MRQPFGELFNKSRCAADLQRFEYLRVAGMRRAESQVLTQGAEKQARLWQARRLSTKGSAGSCQISLRGEGMAGRLVVT